MYSSALGVGTTRFMLLFLKTALPEDCGQAGGKDRRDAKQRHFTDIRFPKATCRRGLKGGTPVRGEGCG